MTKLETIIPYVKKIKIYINHMTKSLSSADISIFLPEFSNVSFIVKYWTF